MKWYLITYKDGKAIDVYTKEWLKRFTKFRRIEKVEVSEIDNFGENTLIQVITTKKELRNYLRSL